MRALELLVPGLAPDLVDPTCTLALHAPSLYRLACRARKRSRACAAKHELLCQRFGVERTEDWPVAPLTLLSDSGEPGQDYCLRADPVHLVADRSALLLADPRRLLLAKEEAEALAEDLAAHFESEDVYLSCPHPRRWYVRTSKPARIACVSPAEATGRSIDPLLPTGPDAAIWIRRANEAQMLLHQHSVNAAREAQGALPVNSIWFWGGGRLARPAVQLAGVWSDSPLARGLALAASTPLHPPPCSAQAWLDAALPGIHFAEVVAADRIGSAGPRDQGEDSLRQLEENWFAPLRHALGTGRLEKLSWTTLMQGTALSFEVTRADLWKLWRRSTGLPKTPARGLGHA